MSKKILILDDEIIIRSSLNAFLETYGYETVEAETAENAEKLLNENEFDLAIVDMRLPGESGEEFIKKAAGKYNKLKFIIYTGSEEFLKSSTIKSIGITSLDVFSKPVKNMSDMVNRIIFLLGDK